MKARYSVFLLLLIASNALLAQGVVVLSDENGTVVNGTVMHINSSPDDQRDTANVYVQLTGSAETQINVRRYELWPVDGSRNFFCWGVCYTASMSGAQPVWVSQHPLDLMPGQEYDNFHAYYEPMQQSGTARFRFVWFDQANPLSADSSWVDIEFGGTVGISEGARNAKVQLNSWPNPSMGDDITIAHTLGAITAHTELVIYTILGERAIVTPIRNAQGNTKITAGSLRPGVYFANLEQEGRTLATHRIVIAN